MTDKYVATVADDSSVLRTLAKEQADGSHAVLMATEPLGIPSVSRTLTATASSQNTALTATCRRISMYARTADIRYAIGKTAQTANASTSHFIASGERLDVALPPGANIAVIRDTAATANGELCVTELE